MKELLESLSPGDQEWRLAMQLDPKRLPAHVAVIMDGNGRWARQRNIPRILGHKAGIDPVRTVVETCARLGLQALTLGVLTVTGAVQVWEIGVLAAILGHNNAFENPARQSLMLELVGPEHLRNAVTLNTVLMNVARMIGPAVAGLIIAAGGYGVCFLINAASFVAVVVSLVRMDTSTIAPAPPSAPAAPPAAR